MRGACQNDDFSHKTLIDFYLLRDRESRSFSDRACCFFQDENLSLNLYPIRMWHPLRELLQKMVYQAGESGLLTKWRSDWEQNGGNRGEYLSRSYSIAALSISDMVPAFYILVLGWILAIVGFGIELLWKHF